MSVTTKVTMRQHKSNKIRAEEIPP